MAKKITARMLQAKSACSDQVEKFKELFPEGIEVTEALCVQHAQVFDWSWSAENLLTPEAWKVYCETTTPAWKVYSETTAAAWKVYTETAAAWKVFDETRAAAFARAYLSLENTEGQT